MLGRGTTVKNRSLTLKKKIFCCVIASVILFILLNPDSNGHSSYSFMEKDLIFDNLHKETAKNFKSSAILYCLYRDIIFDETTLSPDFAMADADLAEGSRILDGGEYYPTECKPKFSVAIIVPYREHPVQIRNVKSPTEQLRSFLVYMHNFLQMQRIHYKIFVVEQVGLHLLFNRAKLWNIGAKAAMKAGYPCLILHDMDLLPMNVANIYACTKLPRHMSPCINSMRFVVPHLRVFYGVKSILSSQYLEVNGMSNIYSEDSGRADRDLYFRLESRNMTPCRFEPRTSRYYDVSHRQIKLTNWDEPFEPLRRSFEQDGLSTLRYTEVVTVKHRLFTHIVVDLAEVSQGLEELKKAYTKASSDRFNNSKRSTNEE